MIELMKETGLQRIDELGDADYANVPHEVTEAPLINTPMLSYSRNDTMFVDWLWQELDAIGQAVWLDRKDIQPGDVWDDMIDTALKSCPTLLLVLSSQAMASENVAQE